MSNKQSSLKRKMLTLVGVASLLSAVLLSQSSTPSSATPCGAQSDAAYHGQCTVTSTIPPPPTTTIPSRPRTTATTSAPPPPLYDYYDIPVTGPCLAPDGRGGNLFNVLRVTHGVPLALAVLTNLGQQCIDPNPLAAVPAAAPAAPTLQDVVRMAKAQIQPPSPTFQIDYKTRFLTGAPVQFTASVPQSSQQSIGGIAQLYTDPIKYVWDFGDSSVPWVGQTATHTYKTKSPNVTVKLSITWHGYLVYNNQRADITPDITVAGTINRPIVEVWSALTEPNA